MSNEKVRNILKAAFFTPRANGRWGLPMLGESDPGVGKSSIVEYDSKSYGLKPITLIGSLRPPEDFLGFPKVSSDGQSFEYIPPKWAVEAAEAERAVVFFDEFTAGQSARTFSAMLRIILEGTVGEFQLPKGVRFVGMCNPPDQSPGGQELPLPLANRFGHLTWSLPSTDDWVNYLMSSASSGHEPELKFDPEQEEKRVMKNWEDTFAWAVGIFAGVFRSNGELLHNVPEQDNAQATKGWSSPRSNEFAIRALAASRVHGLSEIEQEEFISAFVGPAAAGTILQWMRTQDLPDAIDILSGKIDWQHDSRRLDITYALLTTMTRMVTQADAPKSYPGNFWKAVNPIIEDSPDLITQHVSTIVKSPNKELKKHPDTVKTLKKLAPVLRNARVSRK